MSIGTAFKAFGPLLGLLAFVYLITFFSPPKPSPVDFGHWQVWVVFAVSVFASYLMTGIEKDRVAYVWQITIFFAGIFVGRLLFW